MRSARAHPVAFHDDAPRPGRRVFADGSVSAVLRTGFDVSAYTREVAGRLDVDLAEIAHEIEGLGAEAIAGLRRDLAYLHRVESAALTEARTMLSSWTANEARITAFLASWLFERYWWARAVGEVRDALGAGAEPAVGLVGPAAILRRQYVERILPLVGPAWTALAAERVTAGHMARMAIQEGSLLAALRALAPRLDRAPSARGVLEEVATRRERAVDFFTQEARARITRSRGEAIVARIVLAVGGDPLRPAGQRVEGEDAARASIFAAVEDRAALRAARFEITRLLPASRPLDRALPGGPRGL